MFHISSSPDIVPDIDPDSDIGYGVHDIGDIMTRYRVGTRYMYPISIWNPDTWYETLQKYMYRYIPCIYQYMSVQDSESCTDMYRVCTSTVTRFLYWYVHGMYFTLFCNASMYQYVLDKDRTIFSRHDAVTQS